MGTTPLPVGTNVSETINGKEYGRSLLADTAGADAMGVVGSTPGANTLLGRLKAVADALLSLAGLTSSADSFKALSASSTALSPIPKALYITTGGTVIVEGADGVSATFTVPDQSTLPIRPRKLTGGSASGVIGLY